MVTDEDLLLALLNSSPVIDGASVDLLEGAAGEQFFSQFGGKGGAEEHRHVVQMRSLLHEAIRGNNQAPTQLALALDGVVMVPQVSSAGLEWHLKTRPEMRLSARAAIAWSKVLAEAPGRLRACANEECNLFLLDRSRPGTAKWCSMATCGNRMKARTYANRHNS